MAQFHAVIQGARGEASRLGSKQSGIVAHIQSWEGQVNVVMYHASNANRDMVRVSLAPHAHDGGASVLLYEGPCDAWRHAHERRLTLAPWQRASRELASQATAHAAANRNLKVDEVA
jgi:hypothetical protein